MKKAAALAALVAIGLAIGLGAVLARARGEETQAYARDRASQRRAVAASRRVEAVVAAPTGKVQCVTGLDTFAVGLERTSSPLPDGRARRVAALKGLSDAAVRAERTAELARPAPTLPQRMGLKGGEPIAADKRACDGAGYAELR